MSASAKSVLFLVSEPIGDSLSGPSRRSVKLAEALRDRFEVSIKGLDDPGLRDALRRHDVTVTQLLPSPRRLFEVARAARRLVVDVIAPLAFEVHEIPAAGSTRAALTRWRARELVAHLELADFVLCTNERQRDLLSGVALATSGVGALHGRLAVVPHGLDSVAPRRGGSPLRGDGAVGGGDRLAVWAGGMWSWLDPLTAIRAVEALRSSRPDLKLAFVGSEPPNRAQRLGHAAIQAAAITYVRDHELDDSVIFRPRWLPREAYFDHLMDADVGLSLHGVTLEARFASRTRILDYLEAALPVICSEGDVMAEFVSSRGLGAAVEPLDVRGCAHALDEMTRNPRRLGREPLEPLLWKNVAQPLMDYCNEPRAGSTPSSASALGVSLRSYPVFLRALLRSARQRVA